MNGATGLCYSVLQFDWQIVRLLSLCWSSAANMKHVVDKDLKSLHLFKKCIVQVSIVARELAQRKQYPFLQESSCG